MMQLINLTFLIGDYEKAQKLFDSYSASMPEWSQNLLLSLLTREQKGAKKYPGNPEIFLTVAVAQYMLENGKAPLLDFVILPEDSISCNATCCVRDAKICKFKTATPTRIITFLYGEDTYVGIVHHLDQGIRAGNLPFIFRKIIPNNGHNTLIRCLRAFSEENFKEAVPLINVVSAYFPNNPQIDEFRTELLKLCRQLGIN